VNTYDLIGRKTLRDTDGFEEVNAYIMEQEHNESDVVVVPYGYEYAAPLVTSSQPNQVSGINNGTFTSDANATAALRPATSITGKGSGATFTYLFDGNGDLSTIVADTAGQDYLEGDMLSITTTAAHGSQTIQFRLVQGSNRAEVALKLIHDRTNPPPFAVREVKVDETTNTNILLLRKQV